MTAGRDRCRVESGPRASAIAVLGALAAASFLAGPVLALGPATADGAAADALVRERLEWFQDMKLGLLLHWGPYSQWGVVESWSICPEDEDWCRRRGPYASDYNAYRRAYENLPATFNPVAFDPGAWADAAKDAGMRYVVFTTKHHDGFCMFDTKRTDYRITGPGCAFASHPRADVTKEIFDAFRKRGFGVGAYFSKPDWHCPDYWWPAFPPFDRNVNYDIRKYPAKWESFKSFTFDQIRELMSGYGPIDILWLDGGWVQPMTATSPRWGKNPVDQDIDMPKLAAMARSLQPGLIIVDRAVEGPYQDYRTPEQEIPEEPPDYVWETCMTMATSWSYVPNDAYKSPRELVHALARIVAKGGNLLLNIGPSPEGELPPESLDRLRALGAWMKVNGKAIYGTRSVPPYQEGRTCFTRATDGSINAIHLAAEGETVPPETVRVDAFSPKPGSAITMLGSGEGVAWERRGRGFVIRVPAAARAHPPCDHAWTFAFTPDVSRCAVERNADAPSNAAQPYRNAALPVEARVSDLLSRMTPEEKFWQLFMLSTSLEGTIERCEHGAFGFQISSSGDSACSAAYVNRIQRRFVEGTRLGIPIVAFDEAVHGLVLPGATVFPQAIALAATFDVRLMETVAARIADECRSRGIRQVLSPVVNVASDVRWGRVEETYGEDPYLASEMGVAFTRALERAGVVTTPKHFVANVGDGGRDSYAIALGERALREIHFPPFEACIRRGGSRSIMMAYNSVDGAPCTASEWLMRRVLKEELGFTGFVISDAAAVGGANVLHFTAADYAEATARAMNAGLDVIFQTSFDHYPLFMKAFEEGRIDSAAIDEAVSRVLRAKFELGLFEQPYVETTAAEQRSWGTPGRRLAETAALESIVLLRNEDGTLPLSKKARRIAVIGADAREARLGGYSGPGSGRINIFEGIWLRAGGDARVAYARGCGRMQPARSGGSGAPDGGTKTSAPAAAAEEAGIAEAVTLARASDVAVVVAGIEEGEFRDRARLALPGRQEELILRVADTGTPVVVVLVGGSAVTMSRWLDRVGAVLDVWYPGEAGGTAVAAVLFGDANPAGRLPVTFPLEEGQLPLVYNHKPTGRGDGYLDLAGEPLFPFGFGLSYTTFEYADLSFDRDRIAPGDSAVVRCAVRNAGPRAGDEVVQLYIRDEVASVARPVMELKGFRRVRLDPGETREVRFTIAPETLRMFDARLRPVVEPGSFRVMIGSSSKDIRLSGILTVSG